MKSILQQGLALQLACAVMALAVLHPARAATKDEEMPVTRERLLMDFGWKFHMGNEWGTGEDLAKAGSSTGPAKRSFPDAGWRTLNLPHDWAIELPFDSKADGSHGFKAIGRGYPDNSVGWYRRPFYLRKSDAGRRVWIEFDGVFRDCRVFVNGYLVGHHESGYSSFRYDVTDVVNCGVTNMLAVRVDASQFEGWFYEGAGIYRHVWLVKTGPLAVAPEGTFVYTHFDHDVPHGSAKLSVQTRLLNFQGAAADAVVHCEVFDPANKLVAKFHSPAKVAPWSEAEVILSKSLSSPVLWSPESPNLYKLVTYVEAGGKMVDLSETEFGVRTMAFDVTRGFLLNGEPYELKGTCNHQDHAGVGSAIPDAVQQFRVARLKEMGCNACRTSHNPPTPEFLEACDRLGMIVMDENRLLGSDAENLSRLSGLIHRDRNHACVLIWSIANEEFSVQDTPAGGRIAETMQRLIKELDPTRPITYAAPVGNDFQGINKVIEVRGWNYHVGRDMDDYHAAHPTQPNVGTEQASTVCTRGIYANDKVRGYVNAYDDNAPRWAHTAETWWKYFADRPWLSGGFAWTGFDYRGEPTPYSWPCINSHFGILDTCGFPKDNFYYYQSWWTDRPVVHLLPHWNWPGRDGQEIDVRCFSNGEEVELLLNDVSLGRKPMPRNSHLAWKVKYAPGLLTAKAYKGDKIVAEERLETTGAPAAIRLTPSSSFINADGRDVSVVTVAATDPQGRIVPIADNMIHFDLSGPGKILGVGNGDPSCHEPDVFVTEPSLHHSAVTNWRMLPVPSTSNRQERPEVAENFDDQSWGAVDVQAAEGPLEPDQSAVFRAHYAATSEDLAATNTLLNFGMIDDQGWIYVNGHYVGEDRDWSSSPSYDVGKFLHAGDNTIAVLVRNHDGPGGINKGVSIVTSGKAVVPEWSRSLFNGLAQIIVQSTPDVGDIQLTAQAEGLTAATVSIQTKAPVMPCPLAP